MPPPRLGGIGPGTRVGSFESRAGVRRAAFSILGWPSPPIEPVHQARPDWLITTQLAKELGVDFGQLPSAITPQIKNPVQLDRAKRCMIILYEITERG